ncbi:radical SAM family heme chaperone HemW [Desulfotomaculum copahuensis]|uniref:Heme chaperone HemW n=1 Tax=Desulfotomaculum copahuensis TaxID=1838280 RepID=A0A1B7LF76_9FIRM|nr:radical SAM family heme chaperone HemW [Desulfotomaculum copahuensis]OAT82305.1 coproporphyrinogen III oxidase [Desulfotomaculum copahuensis]
MPIGLYIHVPFCLRKCRYCDFVSYPYSHAAAARYLAALEREMTFYGHRLTGEEKQVATVYIGGGTPTCLPAAALTAVLDRCRTLFQFAPEVEITVEANPGTLDPDKLAALRAAGVNRLSLGVQACREDLLRLLGRVHNFGQAVEAVHQARRAGFQNLSLDLIFGIPGQTTAQWRSCLEQVLDLAPEHVSAYGLQIEENTPLGRAVQTGDVIPCDEETELAMFLESIHLLTARGFEHYEISNFARPGHQCRHNLRYWHNLEYLGLGPAAHSFMRGCRYSNEEKVAAYAARLADGERPVAFSERPSRRTAMGEGIFLGLRLIKGLSLDEFARRYGERAEYVFAPEIDRLCRLSLLESRDGYLRLTGRGLPLANQVFVEFV